MPEFSPISVNSENANSAPHDGLIWSGMVTETLLAELQTGIIPQLVHLVIFDTENDNAVVYSQVRAYEEGEGLDAEHMAELQDAIEEALEGLA